MIQKIIFFGSSSLCLPILKSINRDFDLSLVVTRPDKEVGRKGKLTPSPPKKFALSHNIKVLSPHSNQELKNLENEISILKPDLGVVSDYGILIPQNIFTIPKKNTINIHFSKLPEFRGPSPVQFTILTGKKDAWISIIEMKKKLDSGNIIWQKKSSVSENDTSYSLYQKLFNITAKALSKVIYKYAENKISSIKQNESLASYSNLLSREHGFIPFSILNKAIQGSPVTDIEIKKWPISKILNINYLKPDAATAIERMLRAFTPWPGIWTNIQTTKNREQITKRLKIHKLHLDKKTKLIIDQVQLEGKNPVTWKQLLEGYPQVKKIVKCNNYSEK